jgi:hypothetical protein
MDKFKKGDIVAYKAPGVEVLVTVVTPEGKYENTFFGEIIKSNLQFLPAGQTCCCAYDAFEMYQELKTSEGVMSKAYGNDTSLYSKEETDRWMATPGRTLETSIETGAKNCDLSQQRATRSEMEMRQWCIDRAIQIQTTRAEILSRYGSTSGLKEIVALSIREEAENIYQYITKGIVK